MSLEENKALALRWFEHAWMHGDLDVIDELVHPDHTHHDHAAPHRHHPDSDPGMADAFYGADNGPLAAQAGIRPRAALA